MTLRFILTLLPVLAGSLAAILLQLKALTHLRDSTPSSRLAAFFLGPFSTLSGARYSLEGLRYRGLALAAFVGGALLTALLLLLLGADR